tara:strand:+ start:49 stop:402 length:354 start_codon:yes stop_codon:yes gene_type:complete
MTGVLDVNDVTMRQKDMKLRLRCALEANDEPNCWARVIRYTRVNRYIDEGELMKLLAVNDNFYVFITADRHYLTKKARTWLVHDNEFYVHWVGAGDNMVGCPVTGKELEEDFFMYQC